MTARPDARGDSFYRVIQGVSGSKKVTITVLKKLIFQ